MAVTELTVQQVSSAGAALSYTAATADGEAIDNTTGKFLLHVVNGSGSPITLTVDVPIAVDGNLVVADREVTVPAGGDRIVGPFSKGIYNQADVDTGLDSAVVISTSSQTTVTLAAFWV